MFSLHNIKQTMVESRDPDSPRSFWKNNNIDYYLKRILIWERKLFHKEGSDEEIENGLKDMVRKRQSNPKRIAIVTEEFPNRPYKIIKALVKKGFEVECYFYTQIAYDQGIKNEIKKESTFFYEYSNVSELMCYLVHSDAFVCHYMMLWGNAGNANILLQKKKMFMPIIVEDYDVMNGNFFVTSEMSIRRERFAYEHADGVVFRQFFIEYLKKHDNYSFKREPLLFLDYYSKDDQLKINELEGDDHSHEYSIVYAGGLQAEGDFCSVPIILEFATKCKNANWHFHLYLRDDNAYFRKVFNQLEEDNPFFHYHGHRPWKELLKEMSSYDFGIMPSSNVIWNPRYRKYDFTVNSFKYSVSSKYFDYLCSGLPVVSGVQREESKLFKNEGMLEWCSVEDFEPKILEKKSKRMRRNVALKRELFCIENRIGDLINYYKDTANI